MKKLLIALVVVIAAVALGWWFIAAPAPSDNSSAGQASEAGRDDTYKTLDTEPAPVLSPQQALERFRIAPGFEIELVAAEPLIEDPVAMAWDEYGRLYVVEMRGYMPDVYGNGSDEPVGQVVRLSDDDGDGRMDRSEVFLDGLVNPRAVAVTNQGILVGEPPNLWLCELPNPDADCSARRRVGDYAPNLGEGNVEHLENGLFTGLDNWLYNAKSARSFRFDNGKLEVRHGPQRGQWGMGQDDRGRLFYNHNSTWLQADLFAGEDVVEADSGVTYAGLGVNLTDPSEVFSVRVNPGVNRAYLEGTLRPDGRLHKATGVSGLAVYRGDQFPAEYANDVFVPEVAANVVAHLRVSEQGMALAAEHRLYDDPDWGQREFLGSTDERFRPVDALNGPDGALYIIDMYRGIVQDTYFLTDELREQILLRHLDKPLGKGRIWRVRHRDGGRAAEPVNLAQASDDTLLALLASGNGWQRDTAQRLLLARGGDLTGRLAALATGENSIAATHALWTLAGRGELSPALVQQVLAINDPWRQVQALRSGAQLLLADSLLGLSEALGNDSGQVPERVQMQYTLALGQHAGAPAVRQRLQQQLLSGMGSEYVRQAVVRAVRTQEMAFLPELLANPAFATYSEPLAAVLGAVAANAYRDLRGDLTSTEPANPALLDLLALLGSAGERHAWQEVAMQEALRGLTLRTGFEPARLAAMPELFDTGAEVDEALAAARLLGRRAFTWPGDPLALGIEPLTPAQQALMSQGETFYSHCAACHGADGAGVPGLAPALAGAEWVTGPPEWLGRIILQGLTGPVEVKGETFNGVMPPHGHLAQLDDAVLAGLMTYLRRAWGNAASAVDPDKAAAIRENSAARQQPWTVAELRAVYVDRGFRRLVGEYSVSFITIAISEQPEGLYMEATMGGEGLLTQLDDNLFEIRSEDGAVQIEFVSEPDGSVNKLIIHRDGQQIPAERDT
ncbi:DUF7133 domain-containing protein [Parahaliea mediterranea]|uniref:DUF7133 domain-containing protein n=1 Tax=Parahaliea mediterranea TaxID=651086 RepID=UPI000E2ECED5|nr:c-type cytochrome [Parahaliea mediterranea]